MRDVLEPPIELLHKVFPDATRWLIAHSDEANASGVERTATAKATLEALQYLRKVFLQDSVFLRERWPELRLWTHDLFKSQAFTTFADDLKKATTRPEVVNPAASRLHPDAKAYLDAQYKDLKDGQVQLIHNMTTETASAAQLREIVLIQNRMLTMMRGGLRFNTSFPDATAGQPAGGRTTRDAGTSSHGRTDDGPDEMNEVDSMPNTGPSTGMYLMITRVETKVS